MKRRDEGLVGDIAELIIELPEPLRTIMGLWFGGVVLFTGAHCAIILLKGTKQPLPWPLNWLDAIETFNWAGFGMSVLTAIVAIMIAGSTLALLYVIYLRFGHGALERKKAARRKLADRYR